MHASVWLLLAAGAAVAPGPRGSQTKDAFMPSPILNSEKPQRDAAPPPHHHRFEPSNSSTFSTAASAFFQLNYLDDDSLAGFVGSDVVQLGGSSSVANFGCIRRSVGDDWSFDGILGLGLKGGALYEMPTPLLYQLSDAPGIEAVRGASPAVREAVLRPRKFGLLLQPAGGALSLGGVEDGMLAPNATVAWTPVLKACPAPLCAPNYGSPARPCERVNKLCKSADVKGVVCEPQCWAVPGCHFGLPGGCSDSQLEFYSIGVEQIVAGGASGGAERPLLEFAPEVGDTHINATVDSGTSCIILPSSTGGVTSNSPWAAWQAVVAANPPNKAAPIVLTFIVDGREYPVKIEDPTDPTQCVTTNAAHPTAFLLGDVWLRTVLAVHDLTDLSAPRLGLAPVNPAYKPPARPRQVRGADGPWVLPLHTTDQMSYGVNISVGTPRQKDITVLLDTGSCSLAIFSDVPPNLTAQLQSLVARGALAACATIVLASWLSAVLCRDKKPAPALSAPVAPDQTARAADAPPEDT